LYKFTSLSAALVLLTSITACNKSQTASEGSDPLKGFKILAERCQSAVTESDKVLPGKVGGFYRDIVKPIQKSFDVTKTDSLVSPYIAYIKLSFQMQSSTATTEEALQASNTVVVNTTNHWKLMYALQDGKWKLQQTFYSFAMPELNISEGLPNKADFNTLVSRIPATAVCQPI
jgi:hypothetical protein